MQLFLTSTQRTDASLDWGKDSWRDLAKICRLVEGMPLGLLLASAWVDTYTPAEIAAEIERSLDFLESRWLDVPERQRSLRATFDYSWNLLTAAEQGVLTDLAVFHGSFSLQAAGQVCQAPVRVLQSLVDKSLVSRAADGRYLIHDLVRQYAEQKLGETGALERSVRERHSTFYLERMAGWERELKSARQRHVLEEIDWQIGEVQVAWLWAAGQAQVRRLAGALEGMGTYYELRRRYAEVARRAGQRWMGGGRGRARRGQPAGWLQVWQARFCRLLGTWITPGSCARRAGRRWSRRRRWGRTPAGGRRCWGMNGAIPQAAYQSRPNGSSAVQRGTRRWTIHGGGQECWSLPGELAYRLGEQSLGLAFLQEAVALSRAVGEPRQLAEALHLLATRTLILGQWETGVRLIEEAMDCYRAAGDPGRKH